MPTQYDDIGASYANMTKLESASLEQANVKEAVQPLIRGGKVLDLACGLGRYSQAFLEWGAEEVLGVDISAVMVDTAKASSSSDKVRFLVGDCSKAVQFPGGPYDLAFGAWLLNYASSHAEMVNMFRNAAANLREGGFFVGVTPHPTDDPEKHIEAALKARPEQYGGITVQATGKVEDGIAAKVTAMVEPQKIEFDAFYLKKSVYESAAREGGFHGPLTWNMVKLPEEQKSRGHEWDTYMTVPHFCVLVIVKI